MLLLSLHTVPAVTAWVGPHGHRGEVVIHGIVAYVVGDFAEPEQVSGVCVCVCVCVPVPVRRCVCVSLHI